MEALHLFLNTAGLIVRNFPQLLRIMLMPFLLSCAIIFFYSNTGLAAYFKDWNVLAPADSDFDKPWSFLAQTILVLFLQIMLISLSFAAWHRYCLNKTPPSGWFSAFETRLPWRYVLSCFVLFVVAVVGSLLNSINSAILGLFFAIFASVSLFRISVILPAEAIGKPLNIREAWEATRSSEWTIFCLLLFAYMTTIPFLYAIGSALIFGYDIDFSLTVAIIIIVALLSFSTLIWGTLPIVIYLRYIKTDASSNADAA